MVEERLSRQQQREHNRRKLLAAAERIFAEQGIQGASLDDVAKEAGLTKGAVYSNFEGKTDLIIHVIRDRIGPEEQQGFLQTMAAPDLTEDERLDTWGREWARITASGEREPFARMLLEFILYSRRSAEVRRQLREVLAAESVKDQSATMAAALPSESELAHLPPEHILRLINALDIGLTIQSLVGPDIVPYDLFRVGLRLMAGLSVASPKAETPQAEPPSEAS
ncbi:TetR/AcrR family transcriptional regulator [Salinactinospora qingdaonensis]|uniref:TetR/AcrR family transcriptional regulator n=1 Tax=Salinactinospora qingdaonensis TaxID=702744 RepID=A0ABP7FH32_9ACTN